MSVSVVFVHVVFVHGCVCSCFSCVSFSCFSSVCIFTVSLFVSLSLVLSVSLFCMFFMRHWEKGAWTSWAWTVKL